MPRSRPALLIRWALIALSAISIACQNDAQQLSAHLEQGESYLEEKQWNEAALEFRSAMQIDPNEAKAHYGLARAAVGKKELSTAFWELKETVRLDPNHLQARVEYGQFLLFGKDDDLEAAVENAEAILAIEADRLDGMVLRARALEALERHDEAREAYEAAIAAHSEEGAVLLLSANHLRTLDRREEAETQYQRLTEVAPIFASYVALGGFLTSQGDRTDEAEAAYRRALEVAKDEEKSKAHAVFANFLMRQDRMEEAEASLREAIAAAPGDTDLVYGLARFLHAQGRIEEADGVILSATETAPDDARPFIVLSAYRAQNGDLDGAIEASELALGAEPDNLIAKLRKAELLIDAGFRRGDTVQLAEGKAIVDAALSRDPSQPDALFVRGKYDLADGRPDDAVAALRQATDGQPGRANFHFLLGSALFLKGDRTAARTELSRALEIDANMTEARRMLAQVHAALGDHELAIEAGRRALDRSPNARTRILVAQSLVQERRLEEAIEELERIPEAQRDAEASYAMGRVELFRGNRSEAASHFEAALEQQPHRVELLRSLLQIDAREGRLETSAERIREALAANPEDPQLNRLFGDVALVQGRLDDAERALRKAIELNPNDLAAYQSLARYLAVAGRSEEIVRTYEIALENNPRSGALHMLVGTIYDGQNRNDAAIERYEEALRLQPALSVAKNNLAYLLAEEGRDLDRALDLAQQAKAELPDNPNTADTLGWVLYKRDVPSAAVGYLKEAVGSMPPGDPQAVLARHHLAQAYVANDEPDRAREVWEQALEEVAALIAPDGDRPARPEPAIAEEIRTALATLE